MVEHLWQVIGLCELSVHVAVDIDCLLLFQALRLVGPSLDGQFVLFPDPADVPLSALLLGSCLFDALKRIPGAFLLANTSALLLRLGLFILGPVIIIDGVFEVAAAPVDKLGDLFLGDGIIVGDGPEIFNSAVHLIY